MSDYLWDKTGEPDEEVERLEALLAPLAHKARTLALPAPAAPAPVRRSRLFAPAALAAAAALLIAALAGAAALLRSRASGEVESTAASRTRQSREEAGREKPDSAPEPAPVTQGGAGLKDERDAVVELAGAAGDRSKVEKGRVEDFGPNPRAEKGARLASAQRRRQRPAPSARVGAVDGGAPVFEAMSAGGGAPSFFENTRLLTKEQLVYALRLTGAKLRDVRQKTRGDEGELRRQGFRREASEQP